MSFDAQGETIFQYLELVDLQKDDPVISQTRKPEYDLSCASSVAILVEFGYPFSSDSVCRAISDAALRRLPQSAKVTSSHPLTRSNTCCLPKLTTLPATTSTQQRGRPYNIKRVPRNMHVSHLCESKYAQIVSRTSVAITQPWIRSKKRLVRSDETSS